MTNPISVIFDRKTKTLIEQEGWQDPVAIVFKGGGPKGSAYIGANEELERYGIIKNIRYAIGTSSGAIAALACSLGYSAAEIDKLLSDMPMEEFLEQKKQSSFIPEQVGMGIKVIKGLMNPDKGVSSGEKLVEWVKHKLIEPKLGNPDITFKEFEELRLKDIQEGTNKGYKSIYITGSNISKPTGELEIFSAEESDSPNMPIWEAIRISTSIPGIFKTHLKDGKRYVDGALKDNIPARHFNKIKFTASQSAKDFNDAGANKGMWIFTVDSQEDIDQFIWNKYTPVTFEKSNRLTKQLLKSSVDTRDAKFLREAATVIPLPDCKISTIQFDVDKQGKIEIISAGKKATREFLEQRFKAAYNVKTYGAKLKDPSEQQLIEEWLSNKNPDEMKLIIASYVEMKKKIISNTLHLSENSPDSIPSISEIDNYISFLVEYSKYLIDIAAEYPAKMPAIPLQHVNLIYNYPENSWHHKIEKDLKERLVAVNKEIREIHQLFDGEYRDLHCPENIEKVIPLNSDKTLNRKTQVYVNFFENLRYLIEEKNALENKLDLNKSLTITSSNDNNSNNLLVVQKDVAIDPLNDEDNFIKISPNPVDQQINREDKFWIDIINCIKSKLSGGGPTYPSLQKLFQIINLQNGLLVYTARGNANTVITLNLLDKMDRNIFLLAAAMYMYHLRGTASSLSKDYLITQLLPMYLHTESTKSNDDIQIEYKKISLPKNLNGVAELLKVKTKEIYSIGYRIEELVHYFASIDGKPCTFSIDNIKPKDSVLSFFSNNPLTTQASAPSKTNTLPKPGKN